MALVSLAALGGVRACARGIMPVAGNTTGGRAVDSAAGGGSLVNKATVAGLRQLSKSGVLDPEPQRWLEATIALLESDNPNAASSEAKKLIINGCADNGYPLRNLK